MWEIFLFLVHSMSKEENTENGFNANFTHSVNCSSVRSTLIPQYVTEIIDILRIKIMIYCNVIIC